MQYKKEVEQMLDVARSYMKLNISAAADGGVDEAPSPPSSVT